MQGLKRKDPWGYSQWVTGKMDFRPYTILREFFSEYGWGKVANFFISWQRNDYDVLYQEPYEMFLGLEMQPYKDTTLVGFNFGMSFRIEDYLELLEHQPGEFPEYELWKLWKHIPDVLAEEPDTPRVMFPDYRPGTIEKLKELMPKKRRKPGVRKQWRVMWHGGARVRQDKPEEPKKKKQKKTGAVGAVKSEKAAKWT